MYIYDILKDFEYPSCAYQFCLEVCKQFKVQVRGRSKCLFAFQLVSWNFLLLYNIIYLNIGFYEPASMSILEISSLRINSKVFQWVYPFLNIMVGRGCFVMVQRNGLPCLQCTTRIWFLGTTNQPIFSDLKQKGQLVLHNCKMPSTIINRVTNAATNLINRNLPFSS